MSMTSQLRKRSLFLRGVAATITLLTSIAGGLASADAEGVARVQQSDNSVQQYPNVTIRVVKPKALTVTTADGKGTLILDQAACSYSGELQRCLLTHASLRQSGVTKDLDFDKGTVYVNLTEATQPLSHSSATLRPKGVLVAIRSKVGTFITVTGTIDEVEK
jgi:hypothetical protein